MVVPDIELCSRVRGISWNPQRGSKTTSPPKMPTCRYCGEVGHVAAFHGYPVRRSSATLNASIGSSGSCHLPESSEPPTPVDRSSILFPGFPLFGVAYAIADSVKAFSVVKAGNAQAFYQREVDGFIKRLKSIEVKVLLAADLHRAELELGDVTFGLAVLLNHLLRKGSSQDLPEESLPSEASTEADSVTRVIYDAESTCMGGSSDEEYAVEDLQYLVFPDSADKDLRRRKQDTRRVSNRTDDVENDVDDDDSYIDVEGLSEVGEAYATGEEEDVIDEMEHASETSGSVDCSADYLCYLPYIDSIFRDSEQDIGSTDEDLSDIQNDSIDEDWEIVNSSKLDSSPVHHPEPTDLCLPLHHCVLEEAIEFDEPSHQLEQDVEELLPSGTTASGFFKQHVLTSESEQTSVVSPNEK